MAINPTNNRPDWLPPRQPFTPQPNNFWSAEKQQQMHDLFANAPSARREEIENALLLQMADQYATYAPKVSGDLYQMSQENPGYFNTLWGQQRQQIQRGGEQLLGGTLTGLQRSGMINSGQSANLLAGLQRGQGEAMSNAYLQNRMSEDERQRMLLALLGGQVNPLGGQAMAGYSNLAQRDIMRQQIQQQRDSDLWGGLGQLSGIGLRYWLGGPAAAATGAIR